MSEFLPALTQETPRGSARVVDQQLDLPNQGVGQTVTLVTSALTRGGEEVASFLTSSAGSFGIRNGRPVNIHNDGNGALLRRIIPHRIGTAHGGKFNPEYAGLIGLRIVLAINAQADADATALATDLGVCFFPADMRSAGTYHQLVNDGGNNRDKGFGLIRRTGAWRFLARQNDADGNPIPLDVDIALPWPTADLEEYVACDFVFRQQNEKHPATLEVWLNGIRAAVLDWGAGSLMPRPDGSSRGDAYGWVCALRSITGPVADGRELRIAGMHYVAGPDVPGVLWS